MLLSISDPGVLHFGADFPILPARMQGLISKFLKFPSFPGALCESLG